MFGGFEYQLACVISWSILIVVLPMACKMASTIIAATTEIVISRGFKSKVRAAEAYCCINSIGDLAKITSVTICALEITKHFITLI